MYELVGCGLAGLTGCGEATPTSTITMATSAKVAISFGTWGSTSGRPTAWRLSHGAQQLRLYDWAYFAPWSWINYWPNFLEGMSHEQHAWKANNGPDRIDGSNGWGSPIVRFVQHGLQPYLLVDHEILRTNPPRKATWVMGRLNGPIALHDTSLAIRLSDRLRCSMGVCSATHVAEVDGPLGHPDGPIALAGVRSAPLTSGPDFTSPKPSSSPRPFPERTTGDCIW